MRTVTYQSVRDGISVRMGLEPERLLENTAVAIAEYVTSRVREAWEMDAWWPWVVGEFRPLRPDYDAAVTYAAGDEVWDPATDAYYEAIATTTGNAPTDLNFWAEMPGVEAWLDLQEPGRAPVGELLQVWSSDPLAGRGAREYDFVLQGERAHIVGRGSPLVPWIVYTRRPPKFTAREWSASVSYVADSEVFLPATGECYVALVANSGVNPATDSAVWERQEMPHILSEWAKAAAYADTLREDGQWEKAEVAERKALRLLDQEFDKVQLKQSQRVRFSVVR
jgi:hypothetical protein